MYFLSLKIYLFFEIMICFKKEILEQHVTEVEKSLEESEKKQEAEAELKEAELKTAGKEKSVDHSQKEIVRKAFQEALSGRKQINYQMSLVTKAGNPLKICINASFSNIVKSTST